MFYMVPQELFVAASLRHRSKRRMFLRRNTAGVLYTVRGTPKACAVTRNKTGW